ncbi:RRM domain-containing protein [Mycena chlorophos]|uniref:RRM domain-containing protein n=1 Tax=Mycena chlorophos TaxID=658473 RepID=A0A8H6WCA3_MYCCL|nr:RRM domain-containing protein [Mycena chlorophos]
MSALTRRPLSQIKSPWIPWTSSKPKPPQSEQPTRNNTTIRVRGVPPEARASEVLDLVLSGPIFHVHEEATPQPKRKRNVDITFYTPQAATAFLEEVTRHQPVMFYNRTLEFVRIVGKLPPALQLWHSRTIRTVLDRKKNLTAELLRERLKPYEPLDRLTIAKGSGLVDEAFVSFLSTRTAPSVIEDLRKAGFTAQFARDRSRTAGLTREQALKRQSHRVVLSGFPAETTLPELTHRIRGGPLHDIQFRPDDGVAYVRFLYHQHAAAFYNEALYRGRVLRGRRLSAMFDPNSWSFPDSTMQNVRNGATRCLNFRAQSPPSPELVERECISYGPLEQIQSGPNSTNAVFTNILDAIRAFVALSKSPTLSELGVEIKFGEDPCAIPLLSEIKAAKSVHKEVEELLRPK